MTSHRKPSRLLTSALQLVRYGLVGLLVNLFGYLVYLGVTWLGVSPKAALTLLYPVGVLYGYFLHARYSFGYQGKTGSSLGRYGLAHVFGYLTNVGMLFVLVDILGYPHQAVQLAAIFVVAGQLFLTFKFFVFKTRPASRTAAAAAATSGVR